MSEVALVLLCAVFGVWAGGISYVVLQALLGDHDTR